MNKEKKQTLKNLHKLFLTQLKIFNMEDWNIKLAYEPNEEKTELMESDIDYAEYKTGRSEKRR